MKKKSIILFLFFIGMNLHSNSSNACSKEEVIIETKTECCKAQDRDTDHDCNKKCNNHDCDCSSSSLTSYDSKIENDINTTFFNTIQKKNPIIEHFFYFEVYKSIWHPPKVG
jgi:hypothetical protein